MKLFTLNCGILKIYSWVGDGIQCTLLQFVLYEFFLIECLEVRWHCLWNYCFDLLCLNFRSSLQFKILVVLLVGRFTFEFKRLILAHRDQRFALTYLFQHFIMLSKFSLLLLSIVLLVIWSPLEWKRVEWILRVLLVENIVVTILPVREAFLVKWLTHYWFWIIVWSSDLFLFWFELEWFVGASISCIHVHFVWIDNFSLFF